MLILLVFQERCPLLWEGEPAAPVEVAQEVEVEGIAEVTCWNRFKNWLHKLCFGSWLATADAAEVAGPFVTTKGQGDLQPEAAYHLFVENKMEVTYLKLEIDFEFDIRGQT